jgi:hypothetical protein
VCRLFDWIDPQEQHRSGLRRNQTAAFVRPAGEHRAGRRGWQSGVSRVGSDGHWEEWGGGCLKWVWSPRRLRWFVSFVFHVL